MAVYFSDLINGLLEVLLLLTADPLILHYGNNYYETLQFDIK